MALVLTFSSQAYLVDGPMIIIRDGKKNPTTSNSLVSPHAVHDINLRLPRIKEQIIKCSVGIFFIPSSQNKSKQNKKKERKKKKYKETEETPFSINQILRFIFYKNRFLFHVFFFFCLVHRKRRKKKSNDVENSVKRVCFKSLLIFMKCLAIETNNRDL